MLNATFLQQIVTASSYQKQSTTWDREPHFATSNGINRFWANDKDDPDPWIQVYLSASYIVKGLLTNGHKGVQFSYWVEMIKVKVGISEECLNFIKDEDGLPKVRFPSDAT